MQSTRSNRVNLLSAVVALFAAQHCWAQADPTAEVEMEGKLRTAVVKAVMSEPGLRGVWAKIKPVSEKGFDLELIVDSQPEIEKSQIEELTRLVKSVVKSVHFELKVVDRLPFKHFVDELQSGVALEAELAGAAVDGAYYTTGDDRQTVVVVLKGHVFRDFQRELMVELSNRKLKELFAGSKRPIPLTETETNGGEREGVVTDDWAQAPTEEMEGKLREEVVNAVMSEPGLRGVWAEVERIPEKRFDLKLIVDSQPEIEKSQIAELNRVVKSIVKSVPFKIKTIQSGDRLPFKQFVEELQLDVELEGELAGAAVEGAYYTTEATSDAVIVVLIGRVIRDAQRDLMAELSNRKLKKLFAGSEREIPLTKTKTDGGEGVVKDGVILFTPSSSVAQYCFALGMQKFARGCYAEAYQTFRTAHLDAPGRADIQYWRVVSLIGSGREPDAKRLLEGLAKEAQRKGNVPKEAYIFQSLEPVQGPLRWRLMALENSLFCKSCN